MTRLKELWSLLKARYEVWPRPVQLGTIIIGVTAGALVVWVMITRFYDYRSNVRAQMEAHRDRVQSLVAYLDKAEQVERERDLLDKRLESLKSRLLPGTSGTLAAAHLQDHLTTVANDTGVNVQSTQVMREEQLGEYRQVTVRLTLTATIKALADFLETVEYGTMQLSVPFLQVDRKGSRVRRRANAQQAPTPSERVLSSTVEIRGLAAREVTPPSDEVAEES